MKEKPPLSHKVVVCQMLDFETSNSNSEVSKSNSWKITSFWTTTLLQRESFLTMFYTINISPLLNTKKGFMLIIILKNLPIVSTASKIQWDLYMIFMGSMKDMKLLNKWVKLNLWRLYEQPSMIQIAGRYFLAFPWLVQFAWKHVYREVMKSL